MVQEDVPVQLWQEAVNNILQQPMAIVLFFVATFYWIYSSIKTIRLAQERGSSRNPFPKVILLFVIIFILPVSFMFLTEILSVRAVQYKVIAEESRNTFVDLLRWLTIFAVVCPLILIITFKHSKFKSTLIAFFHLTVLLAGWLFKKWAGVLVISVTTFIIFYFVIYRLAQVIYPASSPDIPKEKLNKFWALVWYIWFVQYPVWFASNSAGRVMEERVKGNYFKNFGQPGITWTHAHQVAGISYGTEFSRVAGPGINFLRRLERPITLVDLRTQLRTVLDLNAVTKDGVPITSVLFTAFRIDNASWEDLDRKKDIHPLLRRNPILGKGITLDSNIKCSYPYSSARIHAALSSTTVDSAYSHKKNSEKIYWDEVVLQRVSEVARIVLSERNLNELWIPKNDNRGSSALDEIATEISERARSRLREIGVALFSARIVNYVVSPNAPLRKQLINSWLAIFNQRVNSTTLDGQTEAEILRARAKASARNSFMQAMTESMKQARQANPDFPKKIIALNFISTLQQLLEEQNPNTIESQREKLALWREILLRNR